MPDTLSQTELCLQEAIKNRLSFWERSLMVNGPCSLVLSIPQHIRRSLSLAAGNRALIHQLAPNMLLVELLQQDASNNSTIIHTRQPIIHIKSSTHKRTGTHGFSLIELLVVMAIIIIIAAIAIPRLYGRNDQKLLQTQIITRLNERKEAARHLAPKATTSPTAGYSQPPLIIDFKRLATTSPLRIEGTDNNNDFLDDSTGLALTRYNSATGQWNYAYENNPLQLPAGWQIITPSTPIRTSGGTTFGVPAFAIGFDAWGRPWADTDGDGQLDAAPDSLTPVTSNGEARFWAIYASDGQNLFAVAVHGTGLIEGWNYSRNVWSGWRARQIP